MRSMSLRTSLNPLNNQKGMTLIEIMIVIAIIAGLMAVLGTQATKYLNNAKVENAKIQITQIRNMLEGYNLSCNSYPTTEQGLKALLENPGADSCPNWGPEAYMRKESEAKDPWGKPFIYDSDGGSFVIKSLGKDKKEGGEGYNKDISSVDI